MKLSIIVPVYNVGQYIERCILSLERQDITKCEYEIIAVDDGSTDDSAIKLSLLCEKYDNLKVVHKENGGLSSARNYGLHYATGDFVWFVDSDDYVEPNVLSKLFVALWNNQLDFLGFNVYHIWHNSEASYFQIEKQPLDKVISGEEYVKNYPIGISAWFFIVKRNILLENNLLFVEGVIHEDYDFTLRLYRFIKRMQFINLRVYNYFHRDGSITTTKTTAQSLRSIHSWQIIVKNESKYYNDNSSYSYWAKYYVNQHKYMLLCLLLRSDIPISQKKLEFRKLKDVKAFDIGKTHLRLKSRLKSFFLRVPEIYYLLMIYCK